METFASNTPQFMYQIYPLGLMGGLAHTTGKHPKGLRELGPWIDHIASLGCDALYLGPVFLSESHGYDTIDPKLVDPRLGKNDDLTELVDYCHRKNVKVVLDAVFNHLGRKAPQFQELKRGNGHGRYEHWISGLRTDRNNPCNDGFDYDTWAGHYDLVRLDTDNPEVRMWWADIVCYWFDTFHIDGLRLDAADCLSQDFIRFISQVARERNPEAWLMGEMVHGDYRDRMGKGLLESITNYELYKGIWSSILNENMFELAYSLDRQFGPVGLYREFKLYTFTDNHDVNRLGTVLKESWQLHQAMALMFTMPGIPSIYYGSEFGIPGAKLPHTDAPLRPALNLESLGDEARTWGKGRWELAQTIRRLAAIRAGSLALRDGSYEELFVSNTALAFRRKLGTDEVIVAANLNSTTMSMVPGSGEKRNCAEGVAVWDDAKGGQCRGIPLADGTWTDLWDGTQWSAYQGRINVEVPSHWIRILKRIC